MVTRMAPAADVDALGAKMLQHDRRHLGIVLAERLQTFEHGDAGAEPRMRLRQLHTDGPAADHHQMANSLPVLEDCLVGEVGHRGEAGDRRHRRRGPRGDDEAASGDAILTGDHGRAIDEAAGGLDHLDAETGEALDAVVRRDRGNHAVDVIVHRGGVYRRLDRRDAERCRGPHGVRAPSRGDHGLGGDAAVVEAVAAHLALLDQHDALSEGGGRRRDREAA